MNGLRVIVITGLSGSGKSTVSRVLEDLGFFCVDNLPPILIPKFLELCRDSAREISKVALVIDMREKSFFGDFLRILDQVHSQGHKIEVLFLEADSQTLIHRYQETRRVHPLSPRGSVLEGIRLERKRLRKVREEASLVIDTTNYNVHELQRVVREYFSQTLPEGLLAIHLHSFAYRYGIPPDADLVIDVRFLPNPFFVEGLREKTGKDSGVKDYVLGRRETKMFLTKFRGLLNYLIPLYTREGRSYLTIAVGCTGGRHRSVVLVDSLGERLKGDGYPVRTLHRDLEKREAV